MQIRAAGKGEHIFKDVDAEHKYVHDDRWQLIK